MIADIKDAMNEALEQAAMFVAAAMQQLVGVQCTGEHSAPGEPPQKESGTGQANIDWEPTKDGARVGTLPIGTSNMIGENYMAGWDSPDGIRGPENRRPWLSTWKDRYKGEMDRIVDSVLRRRFRNE